MPSDKYAPTDHDEAVGTAWLDEMDGEIDDEFRKRLLEGLKVSSSIMVSPPSGFVSLPKVEWTTQVICEIKEAIDLNGSVLKVGDRVKFVSPAKKALRRRVQGILTPHVTYTIRDITMEGEVILEEIKISNLPYRVPQRQAKGTPSHLNKNNRTRHLFPSICFIKNNPPTSFMRALKNL
jgi:hypothetical protein